MDKITTFEEFLKLQTANIPILSYSVNIFLAILMSFLLSIIYKRYASSVSKRNNFAKYLVLLAAVITLVITIVKSSLALSLGLVGALSIIRFRTPIKDPEDLIYLFFAIAIGLGMGADQVKVTILSLLIISIIVILYHKFRNVEDYPNIFINLTLPKENIDIKKIVNILEINSSYLVFKRLDSNKNGTDLSFVIRTDNFEDILKIKTSINKIYKDCAVNYSNVENLY